LPHPTQPNQVGGHEGVGKIVKMGPGTESSDVKVGDRVGIKWLSGICGNCPACLSGHDGTLSAHAYHVSKEYTNKISSQVNASTKRFLATTRLALSNNTLWAQVCLSQASNIATGTPAKNHIANYVTKIPDSLESADAAPMLCAGVTVYSALRKSGARSGDWIALLGAGGGVSTPHWFLFATTPLTFFTPQLGHIAIQIAARGMGMRVIGIDSPGKQDIIKDCGAEVYINHEDGNAEEEVKKATGGLGVQAVLVLTAANAAYASAMGLLRYGGTLVVVGLPEGEMKPIATAFPSIMVAKALSIVGIAVGDRKDAVETLEFAERGIVKTHYRLAKMDELTSVFEEMESQKLKGRVVLDLS
jgi:propanol-preferring alcohol dehydrogenase